jgi:hypothetical protein
VGRVESLLSGLERLVRLAGSDLAGEARVLGSAQVSPLEPGAVRVRFDWQPEELDRATSSLADRIRGWAAPSAEK